MPLSMYQASVPPFVRMLSNLATVLGKAAAFAAARKMEPAVLLKARLYPDMYPLARQVQLASDFSKGPAARLAGVEVPAFADTEASFEELQVRIAKTTDFLKSLKAGQIDGAEDREITITLGGRPRTFAGQAYLLDYALPNFYFHVTAAYAIVRHLGIEVGKNDFLGAI